MEKVTGNEPINGVMNDGWTRNDLQGITLRQHYAGLAMQGLVVNRGSINRGVTAQIAVEIADALISELYKPQP